MCSTTIFHGLKGEQGESQCNLFIFLPLVQRLLLTQEKKDRHKYQSKVEIHSSEWTVYSSMHSQPMSISGLMPYEIHS